MQEALALAANGEGITRPNPPVGAVVVKHGRAVGRGYHRKAGGPHAEVVALRDAGPAARGATLYVTLEPCSTQGRTPPCTEAIREAGIRRVVAAARDPNPDHQGRGLRLLRAAGTDVRQGVCRSEAESLLAPFTTWITTGRPRLTLKLAMTLDGRIADRRGGSKWITGPAARKTVQDLRRRCDVVLVGAQTVRADDPSLLPRPADGRKTYRVIAAGRHRIPPDARVLTDRAAPRTLVAVRPDGWRPPSGTKAQRLPVPGGRAGRVSLPNLLAALGARGFLHVLCEGGGRLAESLVRAGLVDELMLFYGPSVLGGSGAPALQGAGWTMENRPGFTVNSIEPMGDGFLVRARPRIPQAIQ